MTDEQLDNYIALLKGAGWRITLNDSKDAHLADSFRRRYPQIPEDYLRFLNRVSLCTNGAETVWFLCANDYHGVSESAYAWNEFERLELEAMDSNDEAREAIRRFWHEHLPFMLSVSSGYAYLAFALTADSYGAVVDGYEPGFRDVSEVAPSFAKFVGLHSAALRGDFGDTLLRDYV